MYHIILVLPIFALPLFWYLPWQEALIFYGGVCFLSTALYWLMWRTIRRLPTVSRE